MNVLVRFRCGLSKPISKSFLLTVLWFGLGVTVLGQHIKFVLLIRDTKTDQVPREGTQCIITANGCSSLRTRLQPVQSKLPLSCESFVSHGVCSQIQHHSQDAAVIRIWRCRGDNVPGPGIKLHFICLQLIFVAILTGLSTFSVAGLSNFFRT